MSGELAPVTRPDGRVYKPRKPPRGVLVEDHDARTGEPDAYVYVLGTHDVERAFQLATQIAATERLKADRDSAWQTWIRQTIRRGDPVFDVDLVRGAAAVVFEVTE